MTKENLIEDLNDLPMDAQLVLSEFITFKDDDLNAIVDIPIIGIAFEKESNEIRFVINEKDAEEVAKDLDISLRPLQK